MRFDRFITLFAAGPILQGVKACRENSSSKAGQSLPILMYHGISDDPEPGTASYYKVNTAPAAFRLQMALLKAEGFRGVSLSEGLASLTTNPSTNPAERPVAVTFDDGFRNFHSEAAPILAEFGFSATMFLATAFIGDNRRAFQPSSLCSRVGDPTECLTWSEVRELHQAGFEFGSHTVTHPRLVDLGWPAVERELRDSRSEMEDRLSASVRTFAYPYAFPQADQAFVSRFRETLRSGGYEACVTTQIGVFRFGDDFLSAPRLPVNSDDDAALFRAKLHGAYDWLGIPQRFSKNVRHILRENSRDQRASAGDKPSGDHP